MKIHWVYPSGEGIHCPVAIGRHVAKALSPKHEIVQHDWNSSDRIVSDPDAVLLGHPHPAWGTTFRRAAAQGGFRRVVMLCPFNGDLQQVAWLRPILERSDLWLALCGPSWLEPAPTHFTGWVPRMRRLDLAIDPSDFPRVKGALAPAGKRRFLYIGHEGWPKNTDYLSRLALARPQWEFSWMGRERLGIPGVRSLGWQDFREPACLARVAEFDFMITVGTADANPATVLEAMAWGLLPVCTPQSGYTGQAGIYNVPLDDVSGALSVLDKLQGMLAGELDAARAENDRQLQDCYTWDHFVSKVEEAILATGPRPSLASESWVSRRTRWSGRYSPVRLAQLRTTAGNGLDSWRTRA
jgi:hypothetical protein